MNFVEKERRFVHDFFHCCSLNKCSPKVGLIRKIFDTNIPRKDTK